MLSAGFLLLFLFFADGLFLLFAAGLGEILVPVRLLTALWVSAWFGLLDGVTARACLQWLPGGRLVVHVVRVVLWRQGAQVPLQQLVSRAMVLEKWHIVVHVVDTRVYLFEVAQAELLLLKLNYDIHILFCQWAVTVTVLVKLFNDFLQIRVGDQIKCIFPFCLPI